MKHFVIGLLTGALVAAWLVGMIQRDRLSARHAVSMDYTRAVVKKMERHSFVHILNNAQYIADQQSAEVGMQGLEQYTKLYVASLEQLEASLDRY